MRHGRKTKSKRFNGYKRHLAIDLDTTLVLAVAVLPANRPEEDAAPSLVVDIKAQGLEIGELYIDRGYINARAHPARAQERARRTRIANCSPPTPSASSTRPPAGAMRDRGRSQRGLRQAEGVTDTLARAPTERMNASLGTVHVPFRQPAVRGELVGCVEAHSDDDE